MNFAHVLTLLSSTFEKEGVDCALIGGFALAALGVPRATTDLDFMVAGDRDDDVSRLMLSLGYRELHRSVDAANYSANDPLGRVDYLFAQRRYAQAMLQRATVRSIAQVRVKVLDAEDIIGLKVQSSSNDPKRHHIDLGDIERLIEATPRLDIERVREYFRVFDREQELDAIIARNKP
jgi:hypothetical protein